MPHTIVLHDACVLYPAAVRHLLVQLSLSGLYKAKWTNEIHDEWMRSVLLDRPDIKREQLERTKSLMNASILDCLVEGYQQLIPKIELPDSNDRHVLAAAIQAKASILCTYNLKDFPDKELGKYKIKAMHPDDFIICLIASNLEVVCAEINELRSNLKKPTRTVEKYLETLKKHSLHKTVKMLAMHSNLL